VLELNWLYNQELRSTQTASACLAVATSSQNSVYYNSSFDGSVSFF
jgi:hypothetical protein